MDGTSRKNLGRYAYHSCRPNAETDTIGHKVIIRAIKNIQAGAEITYNYGRDYLTSVPYRGGAPALTDLIGGQVQVYFRSLARVDLGYQKREGTCAGGNHGKAFGGIARSTHDRRDHLR